MNENEQIDIQKYHIHKSPEIRFKEKSEINLINKNFKKLNIKNIDDSKNKKRNSNELSTEEKNTKNYPEEIDLNCIKKYHSMELEHENRNLCIQKINDNREDPLKINFVEVKSNKNENSNQNNFFSPDILLRGSSHSKKNIEIKYFKSEYKEDDDEGCKNFYKDEVQIFENCEEKIFDNDGKLIMENETKSFDKSEKNEERKIMDHEMIKKFISLDNKIYCIKCYKAIYFEEFIEKQQCKDCSIKIEDGEKKIEYESDVSDKENKDINLDSKYKFYIDRDNLKNNKVRKNNLEIENFINEKKSNSSKYNNMINILNIKKGKSRNANERYLINYLNKKFSKKNAINSPKVKFNELINNCYKKEDDCEEEILNKKNKNDNVYDEEQLFNTYTFNKTNKSKVSENKDEIENKITSSMNEIYSNKIKEKKDSSNHSSKISQNSSLNKAKYETDIFESIDLNSPIKKSAEGNQVKITFDLYPKSTKDVVKNNFKYYKGENDNRLLKKILKYSHNQIHSNEDKNNWSSIYNKKTDTIREIIESGQIRHYEKKSITKIREKKNIDKNSQMIKKKKPQQKNLTMDAKKSLNEGVSKKLYDKSSEQSLKLRHYSCDFCCSQDNGIDGNHCKLY